MGLFWSRRHSLVVVEVNIYDYCPFDCSMLASTVMASTGVKKLKCLPASYMLGQLASLKNVIEEEEGR